MMLTPNNIPVFHADHGLIHEHFVLIDEVLSNEYGFFAVLVDLPEGVPTLKSALHGPSCGDEPIREDEVTYARRGDRAGPSRLVHRAPRPVRQMVVIGVAGGTQPRVFTAFGSQVVPPREWWDPSMTPAQAEVAARFWRQHALSHPDLLLREFTVVVEEDGLTLYCDFQAEDLGHALDQAADSHPDADIHGVVYQDDDEDVGDGLTWCVVAPANSAILARFTTESEAFEYVEASMRAAKEKRDCDHEPAGHTVTYSGDGLICDIHCRKCGVSGSFVIDPDDINW